MSDALRRAPDARHPLALLRHPGTVRLRCAAILRAVDANLSEYFRVDRSQLPALAERVARLTRARYPDLRIPYHSRWRHFEAGGIDRKPQLDALLAGRNPDDAARARFDLAVVSVLLDAGAGPSWRYTEPGTGQLLSRSEGLGVASWHAFLAGTFSDTPGEPLRADAAALERIDAAALRALFQASPSNPMVGLDGRAGLLARLGGAVRAEALRGGGPARPAVLYDRLLALALPLPGAAPPAGAEGASGGPHDAASTSAPRRISTVQVLGEVLRVLAPVWTSGSRVQGLMAGDVWAHRWAGAASGDGGQDATTGGWVPFHKLSQWLAYSLVEPLQWAGLQVTDLDALTGLPEYRNGGLLLDGGLIVARDPRLLARQWKPQDDFIIEWRALTVALLDELALAVRAQLGLSAEEMPLACILEGGTWAAGREIAGERREGGAPPLKIDSDGTVF